VGNPAAIIPITRSPRIAGVVASLVITDILAICLEYHAPTVPFFDGVPVRGVHPENPSTKPDALASDNLASTRTRVTASDAEREAKSEDVKRVAAALSLAESQQSFLRLRPWLRATYDLLGDDGHISFHRFQVAVWTLVLGFVFVTRVLSELAMPEFSATMLGLMGISSGTYLGFKLKS
jgi:hypothetical protein